MNRQICRLEEGHNLFPLEYRLSAGNPFRKNNENVVFQKLNHLDDVFFRVRTFGVRVFFHKICLYLRLPLSKLRSSE